MDKLNEMIQTQSREGKITCREALEIADKAGVSPAAVGKALNEMKIKIKGCQLGCF